MTDKERITNEQFIQQFLHGNRSYSYWDGVVIKTELANIIETLGQLGYTRQPEYEPVELEALGKEDILAVISGFQYCQYAYEFEWKKKDIAEAISKATIKYNQSKGQLFKLKE